jgi:hypothetical protein
MCLECVRREPIYSEGEQLRPPGGDFASEKPPQLVPQAFYVRPGQILMPPGNEPPPTPRRPWE